MIKRIGNVLGNKFIYVCVLITVLLFDTVLYIHDFTGPLMKLFLIWGAFIIIWDILNGRKLWQTKHIFWLILFCALYGITIIIGDRQYLSANLKTLAYMVLFSIVLYGEDPDKTVEKWRFELRTIMKVFVITSALLSLICLLTFIFQINIEILTGDGYMHTGLEDNRLWGLYNPNIGGSIDVISILFSLGLILTSKVKRWYKIILLAMNTLLQYICLVLTSSRTALYTLIICLIGFLFLYFNFSQKKMSIQSIKGFALNIVLSVLIGGCVLGISAPVKEAMSYVPGAVDSDIGDKLEDYFFKENSEEKKTKKKENKKVELTRLEVLEGRDGGILTGRLYIWNAGIRAWLKSPVFGISKNAIYDYSKEYIQDKQWLIPLETSLHNGYLTVLVSSGIVGFCVYIVFLLKSILPLIKKLFLDIKEKEYILFALCMMTILDFLISECLEARLVYRTEIFTALFWIILGYAVNYQMIMKRYDGQ